MTTASAPPTDREISRAEAFGRLAARAGTIDACPYEANGDPWQRTMAARFVRAYLGAGGDCGVSCDDEPHRGTLHTIRRHR